MGTASSELYHLAAANSSVSAYKEIMRPSVRAVLTQIVPSVVRRGTQVCSSREMGRPPLQTSHLLFKAL